MIAGRQREFGVSGTTWQCHRRQVPHLEIALIGRKYATVAQTSVAWMLASPVGTSAIIGADTLEQLKDSMRAAESELSAADKQTLDDLSAWS